jgi:hypothetical protein
MKQPENSQDQEQISSPAESDTGTDTSEMTGEELDEVNGGIIIVSGIQSFKASRFDKVALNPQPLPPKELNIGR